MKLEMLDDIKYIKQFDSDDALGEVASQHEQLRHDFKTNPQLHDADIEQIVIAGMGGSALAGQLVRTWWLQNLAVPLVLVRGYRLPAFVGGKTLVICSSYSGNTEETLSAYADARSKGALIVAMGNGGQLADYSRRDDTVYYELPPVNQPRQSVLYSVHALAQLMEDMGLLDGAVSELEAVADTLQSAAETWGPGVPTEENQAKQIAGECLGKAAWIYSGPSLAPAAYKWKIGFNENAKQVASANELPEFNHNELLGWTEHPRQKPFAVVQLQSSLEDSRVQRQFQIVNRLLSGRMPNPIIVETAGESHIEQLLWASLLGDFVSVYLGILNNVNPTRVDVIDKFKQELDRSGAADSDEHPA